MTCVILGFTTSVLTFELTKNPLLCMPTKLLHLSRIFQNISGFNPESAVRCITGNIVSFCKRRETAVHS